jgi:hypothetical protein
MLSTLKALVRNGRAFISPRCPYRLRKMGCAMVAVSYYRPFVSPSGSGEKRDVTLRFIIAELFSISLTTSAS